MTNQTVESIMVPLSEYASVSEDATLLDAVEALKQAQADFDQSKYRHRAILVIDKNQNIVGKVNFMAVLMGLEPKYESMLSDKGPMHVGFTRDFQKSIIEQFGLWEEPLEHLCEKAAKVKIKTIMAVPKEEELIEPEASLNEAIHQIVMGHHQSLLVTKGKKVVGVVRLTDLFEVVANSIRSCKI